MIFALSIDLRGNTCNACQMLNKCFKCKEWREIQGVEWVSRWCRTCKMWQIVYFSHLIPGNNDYFRTATGQYIQELVHPYIYHMAKIKRLIVPIYIYTLCVHASIKCHKYRHVILYKCQPFAIDEIYIIISVNNYSCVIAIYRDFAKTCFSQSVQFVL